MKILFLDNSNTPKIRVWHHAYPQKRGSPQIWAWDIFWGISYIKTFKKCSFSFVAICSTWNSILTGLWLLHRFQLTSFLSVSLPFNCSIYDFCFFFIGIIIISFFFWNPVPNSTWFSFYRIIWVLLNKYSKSQQSTKAPKYKSITDH